jgi:protein-S-isoprenylcysteine O-methyltransferase Ste14
VYRIKRTEDDSRDVDPFVFFCIGNPFFWAVVGMFALIGSSVTLVSKTLRRHRWLNIGFVVMFIIARFMLPLPFPCSDQPRFEWGALNLLLGMPTVFIGLVFLSAVFRIKPWPKPCEEVRLVTKGLYSVVRNPIYLGEILWSLGWAIMWGSYAGMLLIPLWYSGFLLFVMLEEEDLESCLGTPYIRYREQVKGRILPK